MKLYHGTILENIESIMRKGLIPKANWDSGKARVVSLTDSVERAFVMARAVDLTRVELREKQACSEKYAVLEIELGKYEVNFWNKREWWVYDKIQPEHLKCTGIKNYKEVEEIRRKLCKLSPEQMEKIKKHGLKIEEKYK